MYRGSSKLHVVVREEIRAVQYDKKEVADVWETFGSVVCKVNHKDFLVIHQNTVKKLMFFGGVIRIFGKQKKGQFGTTKLSLCILRVNDKVARQRQSNCTLLL